MDECVGGWVSGSVRLEAVYRCVEPRLVCGGVGLLWPVGERERERGEGGSGTGEGKQLGSKRRRE